MSDNETDKGVSPADTPEDVGTTDTPDARNQNAGTEDTHETRTPKDGVSQTHPTDDEPDTFPRSYVEQLRQEAAEARVKAKGRDQLAHRLHATLVAATGRLADPSDLPFHEDHLEDPDALNAAIEALLNAKPHLASRRPRGDIGQGATTTEPTVDLAGILRSRA